MIQITHYRLAESNDKYTQWKPKHKTFNTEKDYNDFYKRVSQKFKLKKLEIDFVIKKIY